MAIKLLGTSITSAYKSVVSTVSKTNNKVSGGSSNKASSTNSKSSSSRNKASASSKSSSSANKASAGSKSSCSANKASASSKSSSSANKVSASSKSSSSANKTSATSKTVGSNVSKVNSTCQQSPSTKYVTNAAAIYNSSGQKVSNAGSVSTGRPSQSYATQTKTVATTSQKSTNKTASVKTKTIENSSVKNTSSVSTGIPKQSYISQPKTSTAKGKAKVQTKLPVPLVQKAPLLKTSTQKKNPNEVSYSNNRPQQSYTHVVAYRPSSSRESAGQMFYMNKTNPTGAKAGASFATSCFPYVGDVKDIQEAVTGKDLITGKKLTGGDRALTITAAVLPVVSGPMLKGAAKGGKIVADEAPEAVKKAGTLIKKNAPEVKKAVIKTDVAKDSAKVLKKKAVEKAKDTRDVRRTIAKGGSNTKIYNTVEYKGTVKVNGEIKDVSRKIYQRNDIDFNFLDETTGLTNLERMQAGKPPIGTDGNPIQLHHILQKEAGPMVEIREITHQEYYSQLHGLIEDGASFRNDPVLNKQYNNFRRSYWKWRAE